jgi:hypothetical protein
MARIPNRRSYKALTIKQHKGTLLDFTQIQLHQLQQWQESFRKQVPFQVQDFL